MSTAVLISGHARTFRHTFANQYWMVLRHLDNPTFFVSVVDDADAAGIEEILGRRYEADQFHVERVTQPTIPEPPGSPEFHAPAAIKGTVQGILRQLWHLDRVQEFAGCLDSFDTVVRLRPDLWFHRFVPPRLALLNLSCVTPYWGSYGGVNDRFAIMGNEAALAYFSTLGALPELLAQGCPLHPESLISRSLELCDVHIDRTLQTEFSTLRTTGQLEWPQIEHYDTAALLHSTR